MGATQAFSELTPEEIRALRRNVAIANGMLDQFIDTIIEHRRDCTCGTDSVCTPAHLNEMWDQFNEGHYSLLLRLAIGRLADQKT